MTRGPQQGRRRSRRTGGGRRGWPLFFSGLALFVFGVVITVVTYARARNGGTYIISYGPIIFGLVAMVRGLVDVARSQRAVSQGVGTQWPPSAAGQQPGAVAAPWQPSVYPASGPPNDPDGPGFALPRTAQAGVPGMASPNMAAPNPAPPPANWYADPRDGSLLRWWDGQAWTGHTHPRS